VSIATCDWLDLIDALRKLVEAASLRDDPDPSMHVLAVNREAAARDTIRGVINTYAIYCIEGVSVDVQGLGLDPDGWC
jgi:hypothetical protein